MPEGLRATHVFLWVVYQQFQCVYVCPRKQDGGSVWVREYGLTDELIHWSTDWLCWMTERVKIQYVSDLRGINIYELYSPDFSPQSASWGVKLWLRCFIYSSHPGCHLNVHRQIVSDLHPKKYFHTYSLPIPPFMLSGLAASSKAIQKNGKLNFKESQSMGTESCHFSQRKSIRVHSSGLAPETSLTLLWPLVPGG